MKYNLEYYTKKVLEFHDEDEKKLKYNLNKWSDKVDTIVYIPGNEQKPWTDSMLGCRTEKMPTKAKSGYLQVGDYHMYLPEFDKYVGICAERKSVDDIYSTLLTGLKRFNREITRFQEDDRFESFIIFAECTQEEFINHRPVFKGKWFNKQAAHMKASSVHHNESNKRGVMNALLARGVAINFAGNRKKAAEDFVDVCRKWIKYNYQEILEISP